MYLHEIHGNQLQGEHRFKSEYLMDPAADFNDKVQLLRPVPVANIFTRCSSKLGQKAGTAAFEQKNSCFGVICSNGRWKYLWGLFIFKALFK